MFRRLRFINRLYTDVKFIWASYGALITNGTVINKGVQSHELVRSFLLRKSGNMAT